MLVDRFPLKAADAFQLAAASLGPRRLRAHICFISGNVQLLYAVQGCGFQVVEA